MQRTRNNNRGVAYEEYLADVAKEQAEEKAAQDAADRAAAQTPEAQYKASVNQLFSEERNVVLNGVIIDSYLAQFGTVERGRCSEEQKVAARIEFRKTATDYVRNDKNGEILCAMVDRNGLHPGKLSSYLICHEVLKTWSGYPEVVEAPAPVSEVVPVVEVGPVLSRSEQMVLDHHAYVNDVVGVDEAGREWREVELDQLPAKDALRLRRLFEKGHRGSSLLDTYHEIKDIQQARDVEIARRGAEEAQQ
jgi:hypothetical protein